MIPETLETDLVGNPLLASHVSKQENAEKEELIKADDIVAVDFAAGADGVTTNISRDGNGAAKTEMPTQAPGENTETIALDGIWGFKLGAYESGDSASQLDESCELPGTLSENEKGNRNDSSDKERLSLKYEYEGKAVYRKTVDIPEDWADKSVTLFIERTKNTRVWVNGTEQSSFSNNDSLAAARRAAAARDT